jgi:hypothetical protein
MTKYAIGRWTFRTKKERSRKISETLQGQPIGVPLTDDDLEFVLAIFDLHPGKIEKLAGRVIKSIVVRRNDYEGHTERCFYIVRDDGSEIDFSAYVPFWTQSQRLRHNLVSAARRAIHPTRARYKESHFAGEDTAICEVSGRTITWDEADVHHDGDWSFDRILIEWMKTLDRPPDVIDVAGIIRELSPADAKDFIAFHDARATLLVVDRRVHHKL